jgi:hypothetical protein
MRGNDSVGFNTLLGAGLQDPDQLGASFQGFCRRLHSVVPALVATPFVVYQYARQIFPQFSEMLAVYGT